MAEERLGLSIDQIMQRVGRQYTALNGLASIGESGNSDFAVQRLPDGSVGLAQEPSGAHAIISVEMPDDPYDVPRQEATLATRYIGSVTIEDAVDFALREAKELLPKAGNQRDMASEEPQIILDRVLSKVGLNANASPKQTIANLIDRLLTATLWNPNELDKILIKPEMPVPNRNHAILIYYGHRCPHHEILVSGNTGKGSGSSPSWLEHAFYRSTGEYAAVGISSHEQDELIAIVKNEIEEFRVKYQKMPRHNFKMPEQSPLIADNEINNLPKRAGYKISMGTYDLAEHIVKYCISYVKYYIPLVKGVSLAGITLLFALEGWERVKSPVSHGLASLYSRITGAFGSTNQRNNVVPADLGTIVNEYYTAAAQLSKAQGGRTPNEKAAVAARLNELKEKYNLQVECHQFFGPYKGVVYEDQLQEITGNMCDKKSTRVLFEGNFEEVVTKLAEFYIENEQRNGRTPVSREKARELFAESLSVIKRKSNPVRYGFTEGVVTRYSPWENVTYHDLWVQQRDGNMQRVVRINR